MYENYGKDVYDDLKRLRKTLGKFTIEEYQERLAEYKQRVIDAGEKP